MQSKIYSIMFKIGGKEGQELQLKYFCDNNTDMSEEAMLAQAKLTLDKEFSVVGVLEMFSESLTVLEQFLPAWFQHASNTLPQAMILPGYQTSNSASSSKFHH